MPCMIHGTNVPCPDCEKEIVMGPADMTVGRLEFNPCRTVRTKDAQVVTIPKRITSPSTGWECPRCHSVWGPLVPGCNRCNAQVYEPAKSAL